MTHGAQKLFDWFGGAGLQATIQDFQQGLNIPMELTVLGHYCRVFRWPDSAGGPDPGGYLELCTVMLVAIFKVHLANVFFELVLP